MFFWSICFVSFLLSKKIRSFFGSLALKVHNLRALNNGQNFWRRVTQKSKGPSGRHQLIMSYSLNGWRPRYSKYVMSNQPSSTLSFQTQAPSLPCFSQMVKIQIQLDSESRSRYYLRNIKNRENSGTLIFDADPWTWSYIIICIREFSIKLHFFQDQPKKKREKTWNWGALKILIESELEEQQLEELVKKKR